MMISVYYKKKTSLNGYLCDMDTARKHGRTFSVLCDLQYPYSFCNISEETSVAGYVAVQDLTKGGDIIRSRTYDAWTPLLIVAAVYLALTMIFNHFAQNLERSLRKNER